MSSNSGKTLVTGGAGFIGSALVRRLVADHGSDAVRVIDDFSSGRRENLAGHKVEVIEGNCAVGVNAGKAVEGVSRIFHLAAIPSVAKSVTSPLATQRATDTTTMVMLDAARRVGVTHFVLASSCALYGHNAPPVHEQMLPDVRSPYAAAKLASESYLRAACECWGMRGTSLRFFNIYGPGQDPQGEYAAVIAKFLSLAKAGKAPTIFGDGRQTRDFVFIDDLVDVLLHFGSADQEGDVINVGTGRSLDLLQLLQAIEKVTGVAMPPKFAPARGGEVRHSKADCAKLAAAIDWKPRSIEAGLEAMWALLA